MEGSHDESHGAALMVGKAELAAIARDLAAAKPPLTEDRGGQRLYRCLLCDGLGEYVALRHDPTAHRAECVWRRSRELAPALLGMGRG